MLLVPNWCTPVRSTPSLSPFSLQAAYHLTNFVQIFAEPHQPSVY